MCRQLGQRRSLKKRCSKCIFKVRPLTDAQSAEKFSLIIEQMDSSSALNPLKLTQEYKMASTMQFAPDLTGQATRITGLLPGVAPRIFTMADTWGVP